MAQHFYDPESRGFYSTEFHRVIPATAVEITEDQYRDIVAAQQAGKAIVPGEGGMPLAVDPAGQPKTPPQQILELEAAITPRRLREALLGADNGWLKAQEAKIAGLRKKQK